MDCEAASESLKVDRCWCVSERLRAGIDGAQCLVWTEPGGCGVPSSVSAGTRGERSLSPTHPHLFFEGFLSFFSLSARVSTATLVVVLSLWVPGSRRRDQRPLRCFTEAAGPDPLIPCMCTILGAHTSSSPCSQRVIDCRIGVVVRIRKKASCSNAPVFGFSFLQILQR